VVDVAAHEEAPGPHRGYDALLFERLAELEPTSFWFRSRNALILWALDRYFPQARSLLEVGCGTGFVLDAIHRARPELAITGGDLFAEGLAVARRRLPDVPLVQLDATAMSFDKAFDVVAALDVIEHIADDAAALRGIRRAARDGGGLLLTVPQHPALWSATDEAARHERRYTRRRLVTAVESAGWRPVRVTSFVSLLLPLLAASRIRLRSGREYELEDEFSLPPFVDRAFESVMTLERQLIRSGAPLPAGGSLLLVARAEP
jgi:SAM-dependent methyltransferase